MYPFKALYGHDCLVPYRFVNPNLPVPAAKNTLEEMDRQLQVIRQSLKKASDRQKSYADLHHSLRIFKEGDKVFLRVKTKEKFPKARKMKEIGFQILWSL